MLVSSRDTNEVLKYETDGTFLGVLATDVELSGSVGMVITHGSELIVSSLCNDKIVEFAASSGAFNSVLAAASSGLNLPSMMLQRIVPEPTTCTLALVALCLAMSRRRAF